MRISTAFIAIAVLISFSQQVAQADYNVKTYGAVGNGVNDDTVAIQAAINAAAPAKGTVYFPEGTYKVTSTLSLSSSFMTIRGEGGWTQQSTILFRPTFVRELFNISAPWNIKISSLHMVGGNANAGILIFNAQCDQLKIQDSSFEGDLNSARPLIMSDRSNTYIEQNKFDPRNRDAYAVVLRKMPAPNININSNITDNYFANTGKGVLIDEDTPRTGGQVEGLRISRNTFINTGTEQITIKAAFHMDIANNVLDQCSERCVWLFPSSGPIDTVHIVDNYFGFLTPSELGVAIEGDNSSNPISSVIIANNRVNGGKYGVAAKASTQYWNIANNIFQGNNVAASTGVLIQSTFGYFNIVGNIVRNYATPYHYAGVPNVNYSANL